MEPGRQCCGSGSRIRRHFDTWIQIPDPKPLFLKLSDKLFGKKLYNSLKTGPNFFLQHFKNKIIYNFVKSVATKKDLATNYFFHPFLLLLFMDPGWVKIRIRDKHPGFATLLEGL
jgi:hypothetical protein